MSVFQVEVNKFTIGFENVMNSSINNFIDIINTKYNIEKKELDNIWKKIINNDNIQESEKQIEVKPKESEKQIEVKPKESEKQIEVKPKESEKQIEVKPKESEKQIEVKPKEITGKSSNKQGEKIIKKIEEKICIFKNKKGEKCIEKVTDNNIDYCNRHKRYWVQPGKKVEEKEEKEEKVVEKVEKKEEKVVEKVEKKEDKVEKKEDQTEKEKKEAEKVVEKVEDKKEDKENKTKSRDRKSKSEKSKDFKVAKNKNTQMYEEINTRLVMKSKEDHTVIGFRLLNNIIRSLEKDEIELCNKMKLEYIENYFNTDKEKEEEEDLVRSLKDKLKKSESEEDISKEEEEIMKLVDGKNKKENKIDLNDEKNKQVITEQNEIPKGKGLIKGNREKEVKSKSKEKFSSLSALKEMILTDIVNDEEKLLSESSSLDKLKGKTIDEILEEICEKSENDDDEILEDD